MRAFAGQENPMGYNAVLTENLLQISCYTYSKCYRLPVTVLNFQKITVTAESLEPQRM